MAPQPDPNQPSKSSIPPVDPDTDLNNTPLQDLNAPLEPVTQPDQIASTESSASYESSNPYLNPVAPSPEDINEPITNPTEPADLNATTAQPEQSTLSAQDELLQPAGTVGSIQDLNPNSTPTPEAQKPKRSLKKIFKFGAPVLLLIIILAVVGFFVMKSGKTSKEALNSFSEASSAIGSKSNSLNTEISGLTYEADQASNIEQASKDYDDAIKKFEEATANLKSDKEALKLAAQEYVVQLKNFKDATVVLAIENAKIRIEFKKVEDVTFDDATSTNLASYTAEVDRISGEYAKISQSLKDVELTNAKAKELRDSYVAYLIQLQSILKEIKTAVINLDTPAIAAAQTKAEQLDNDNAATAKEKEVDNLLGLNSEARKKLEDARQKLNEEIAKANS